MCFFIFKTLTNTVITCPKEIQIYFVNVCVYLVLMYYVVENHPSLPLLPYHSQRKYVLSKISLGSLVTNTNVYLPKFLISILSIHFSYVFFAIFFSCLLFFLYITSLWFPLSLNSLSFHPLATSSNHSVVFSTPLPF